MKIQFSHYLLLPFWWKVTSFTAKQCCSIHSPSVAQPKPIARFSLWLFLRIIVRWYELCYQSDGVLSLRFFLHWACNKVSVYPGFLFIMNIKSINHTPTQTELESWLFFLNFYIIMWMWVQFLLVGRSLEEEASIMSHWGKSPCVFQM